MATTTVMLPLILILTFSSAAISAAPTPPPHPISPNYTFLIATILSTLGFQDLGRAATAANLSTATPITIFAPTDSSLLTCPSCSLPLLLQEHTLLGLYPIHYLRTLAFGTKIETLANNRCLTITATPSGKKVFINGVRIAKQDLFNNGFVIVHALQGFVSHLSPVSCAVETMTTLSFPQQPPPTAAFFIMRLMLKDAMARLRVSGYSTVALAMRARYSELANLKFMTLFAVDDESIFLDGGGGGSRGGGHAYVAALRFHILPNRLMTAADMMRLPRGTVFRTMERGRNLVVTSAGGGGPVSPMRINYEKVKRFDIVNNNRVAVHGLSAPFRQV